MTESVRTTKDVAASANRPRQPSWLSRKCELVFARVPRLVCRLAKQCGNQEVSNRAAARRTSDNAAKANTELLHTTLRECVVTRDAMQRCLDSVSVSTTDWL